MNRPLLLAPLVAGFFPSLALGASLAVLPSCPLAAQTDREPWKDSYYPVVSYSGNDGVTLGARYQWTRRANFDAPYFNRDAFITDVGISASGSYLASVRFKAPGFRRNWRVDLGASVGKQTRFEFYGLGESVPYSADSVHDGQPYYYKVRRGQTQVRGEVSRRIAGDLWLAAMGQWKQVNFTDLPGPSVFNATFGGTLDESDAVGRVALVFDSRDNDYDTHRGLLLDAGVLHGTGEGDGYDRWMFEGRAWIPFGAWNATWISMRAVASAATGDLPLDARFYLPIWEGQVRVLGGAESHRGMRDQRFVGRDQLFGNLTLHHDLFNAGGIAAAGLIAFVDVGRVFETETFSLTTEGMQVGGGGGLYFRLLQTGVYTFNFAKGPDGFVFTLGNSWMF